MRFISPQSADLLATRGRRGPSKTRVLLRALLVGAVSGSIGLVAPMAGAKQAGPVPNGVEEGSAISSSRTPKAVAAESAERYVDAHPGELKKAAGDEFEQKNVTAGTRGTHYVAYERTHRGLPVVGGDFVIAIDANGVATEASVQQTRVIELPSTDPTFGRAEARVATRSQVDTASSVSVPRLVVFAHGSARLAWDSVVEGRSDRAQAIVRVLTDARSGRLLEADDLIQEGQGSGHHYPDVAFPTDDLGDGTFAMRNPNASGVECGDVQTFATLEGPDDDWGGPGTTSALALERACVDVMYTLDREIAMLAAWFNRSGIDGFGGAVPAYVGLDDVNAFYDGSSTQYGVSSDGLRPLTSIDIVAHEYGHQIFDYTPGGSFGDNETGGLNEATGDIFGVLTETYAAHPDDAADYLVGEKADLDGAGPIRNMAHPSSIGSGIDCYFAGINDENQAEVHDAAGPLNHWFYLLAEGSGAASPTCNSSSVSGVGLEKAGEIFYNALLLKTSMWTHAAARKAALRAARTLYGTTDCSTFQAVAAAWSAVNVPSVTGEVSCVPASGLAEVATALIIDSSGSMTSNDPNDLRKDGGVAYLTASQSTDEVGVVDFDDSVRVLSDPVEVGTNRDFLVEAIGEIDSAGGTDLGLGLQAGCASLGNASAPDRAAIFLTDGDGSYDNEAECFAQAGWPIYTIGLGPSVNETLLQEIATSTNGRYLALSDATNLVCEFQQIRAEIGGLTPGSCAANGSVTHGQTATQTITVAPNTTQTTVTLSYAGSAANVSAAPDGTQLALSLVSPTDVTYDKTTVRPDLVVSGGDTYESFTVTTPETGTWTVNVTGVNVPNSSAAFNISTVQLTEEPPPPPPPPATTITNLSAPKLSGPPRVGETVSVDSGTYNVSGLSFGYQWFLNGAPVAGAISSTYAPVAADAGKALRATVTASKSGFTSVSTSSNTASVAPAGGPLVSTTPPRIDGTPAFGEVLVAHPGTWSRSGSVYFYRWRRDGVVIPNSANRSYTVKRRDIGHQLYVEVAAQVPGQDPAAARSAAVAIPKVTPRMTARLVKTAVAAGKRGRVLVTIQPTGLQPGGRVRVKEGSQRLGGASLSRSSSGKLSIRLRRLPAGTHTLDVIYVGSDYVARAVQVVVLTVRRR